MSLYQKLAWLLASACFSSLGLNSSICKMRELDPMTLKSPPSSDIPCLPLLLSPHVVPATVVETCEVVGFLGHK